VTTREALHDLVDELPEDALEEAAAWLARRRDEEHDPVLRALRNAPPDDEPLTEADAEAIRKWRAGERRGVVLTEQELEAMLREQTSGRA
jgi:hypothetical protein